MPRDWCGRSWLHCAMNVSNRAYDRRADPPQRAKHARWGPRDARTALTEDLTQNLRIESVKPSSAKRWRPSPDGKVRPR